MSAPRKERADAREGLRTAIRLINRAEDNLFDRIHGERCGNCRARLEEEWDRLRRERMALQQLLGDELRG